MLKRENKLNFLWKARQIQPVVLFLESFEAIAHMNGERKAEKGGKSNSKNTEPALIVNQMVCKMIA